MPDLKFCPLLSSAKDHVPCDPSCAWANHYDELNPLFDSKESFIECSITAIAENFRLKAKSEED